MNDSNNTVLDHNQESTTLAVETSLEKPRRIGLMLAFLVFGVFGLWAALAPIEGAAYAVGSITVKSYKRLVQHLEGGIVQDIRVRDGDSVEAGDILLVIDNTQSLAQLEVANTQLTALLSLEARLLAERNETEDVVYPEVLTSGDRNAIKEIEAQNYLFRTRRDARDGEIAVLEQRIEQFQSRIDGLEALQESKHLLAESFAEELADLEELSAHGFATEQQLRVVKRNYATASGESAELLANIASTEIQIGETRLQIIQATNQFQNEVAALLAQTQTEIKDILERVTALEDVVNRTEVRAPISGVVNSMRVHTEGGVINPGLPIAEIVPVSDELVIEAQVSPVDIDRVAAGQTAAVHFSNLGKTSVLVVEGRVMTISADTLTDQTTGGNPYYQARIELTPESMAELADVTLVPGMPAEVYINSGSRTFLQYITKPLTAAMSRSLRED